LPVLWMSDVSTVHSTAIGKYVTKTDGSIWRWGQDINNMTIDQNGNNMLKDRTIISPPEKVELPQD